MHEVALAMVPDVGNGAARTRCRDRILESLVAAECLDRRIDAMPAGHLDDTLDDLAVGRIESDVGAVELRELTPLRHEIDRDDFSGAPQPRARDRHQSYGT